MMRGEAGDDQRARPEILPQLREHVPHDAPLLAQLHTALQPDAGIAARLQAMGISNFVAEATGELKAVGRKPDGSPWRIALELPREDRQIARQIIPVDSLSVSTSGDYRHYFEQNGRRYSHTFDARLGRPVEHDLAAVTVLDASALQADGYSTLLLILGGAFTKSAQFPFHVWLPNAMEAPTPVSALLHAGVINAGGFLLIRFADVVHGSCSASNARRHAGIVV